MMSARTLRTMSLVITWAAACAVITASLAPAALASGAERGADAVVLLEGVKQADIDIELNTGTLWLAGGTMATGTIVGSNELLRGRFEPRAGGPALAYRVDGDGQTGHLSIVPATGQADWAWSPTDPAWRFYLNPMVPTNLDVDVGTGQTELALGGLLIDSLALTTGSGDVVLDLSGDWRAGMTGTVDMGAGDLTVLVPHNVGVRLTLSQASGDLAPGPFQGEAAALTNAAYGQAAVTIDLAVDLGAGDITLVEV